MGGVTDANLARALVQLAGVDVRALGVLGAGDLRDDRPWRGRLGFLLRAGGEGGGKGHEEKRSERDRWG